MPSSAFIFISSSFIKVDAESIRIEKRSADLRKLCLQMIKVVEENMPFFEFEFDWTKIRDLDFQEAYQERNSLIKQLKTFRASTCPDLNRHVNLVITSMR